VIRAWQQQLNSHPQNHDVMESIGNPLGNSFTETSELRRAL